VRAEGLEPSRALRPSGFSCRLRLSPPRSPSNRGLVCGLDYPFAILRRAGASGAARLVSTPSRRVIRCRAWLGIATKISEVSPNLGGSAPPVSRRALKLFSSPLRMPFRHTRVLKIEDFPGSIDARFLKITETMRKHSYEPQGGQHVMRSTLKVYHKVFMQPQRDTRGTIWPGTQP
jgi:hypothetical protein